VNLQQINYFWVNGQWPPNLAKFKTNYLKQMAIKLFEDANNIIWIRLDDYKYPRKALFLPEKYSQMAHCEVHNHQFGGDNAGLKTYIRISLSYFWPKLWSDILLHNKTCLRCQQQKNPQTNCLHYNLCKPQQAKCQDPCWPVYPDARHRMSAQIHSVHHGHFHKVRACHGCGEQRGWDCGNSHFLKMVL